MKEEIISTMNTNKNDTDIEQEFKKRRHSSGAISILFSKPSYMSFVGFIDLVNKATRIMIMSRGYNKGKGNVIDVSKPYGIEDL